MRCFSFRRVFAVNLPGLCSDLGAKYQASLKNPANSVDRVAPLYTLPTIEVQLITMPEPRTNNGRLRQFWVCFGSQWPKRSPHASCQRPIICVRGRGIKMYAYFWTHCGCS